MVVAQKKPNERRFSRIGGDLSLDFTNTVGNLATESPDERIHSYTDLLDWSEEIAALPLEKVRRIRSQAKNDPTAADAALKRAFELRGAVHKIFSAIANGKTPQKNEIKILNQILSTAMERSQILVSEGSFVWDWPSENVDSPLWRVARAAADLLISDELKRLRICADEHCGWLFLDTSKNRSRRWCTMSDCGNLAKSRRFRSRPSN